MRFFRCGKRIPDGTFHDIVLGNHGTALRHRALRHTAGSENKEAAQQAAQQAEALHDHAVPLSIWNARVNL